MPEYLAPGVFVEETSFRSKSIEGVSTTTTGFIGPARYGPVTEPTDVVTSLGEFQRIYAGGDLLAFVSDPDDPTNTADSNNFLWHGGRAFFTEGGKRLYVTRVFRPFQGHYPPDWENPVSVGQGSDLRWADGHARARFGGVNIRSRFPGAASNLIVRLVAKAGQNILGAERLDVSTAGSPPEYPAKLGALMDRDVVIVTARRESARPAVDTWRSLYGDERPNRGRSAQTLVVLAAERFTAAPGAIVGQFESLCQPNPARRRRDPSSHRHGQRTVERP